MNHRVAIFRLLGLHFQQEVALKNSLYSEEDPQENLRLFVVFGYKKVDRFHSESVNLSWLRGKDVEPTTSGL